MISPIAAENFRLDLIQRDLQQLGNRVRLMNSGQRVSIDSAIKQLLGTLTDDHRALVLTDEPATALLQLNRNRSLRAAWGIDCESVQSAIASIRPNVLVIDSSRQSELTNLLQRFCSA